MGIKRVDGNITFHDGRVVPFMVRNDGSYSQWGVPPSKQGESQEVVEAIAKAAGWFITAPPADDDEETSDDTPS